MKKKFLWAVLGLFIVGIAIGLPYLKNVLGVATGYSAKIACSCFYISHRSLEDIKSYDLIDIPMITLKEDKAEKSITSTMLGIYSSTAYYIEKKGCTLSRTDDPSKVVKTTRTVGPSKVHLQDSLWPLGKKVYQIPKQTKDKIEKIVTPIFIEDKSYHKFTRGVAIIQNGRLIYERYAEGIDESTPLLGWSMSKTITGLLVGMLVDDQRLAVEDKNLFNEWSNDERKNIALKDLLTMTSGLDFNEDYGSVNDVTELLYLEPAAAVYSLKKPLKHQPGSIWYYASATSNLLMEKIRRVIGDQQRYVNFPYEKLFYPIGMNSAIMEMDEGGNYIGSSYTYANTRDWARLGLFLLQKGEWQGNQLVSKDWVNEMITPVPMSKNNNYGYHIWLNAGGDLSPNLSKDIYYLRGYEGQRVYVIPSKDMVVVRLGLTTAKQDWGEQAFLKGLMEIL